MPNIQGLPPERRKVMPASKAQQKAVNKYVKANYDLYQIKMQKGKKDDIKAVAAAAGESINQYIINAIDQRMGQNSSGTPSAYSQKATGTAQGVRVVSLPSETWEAAQRASEAAREALPDFIRRAVETQAKRDKASLRLGINPATGDKLEKEA